MPDDATDVDVFSNERPLNHIQSYQRTVATSRSFPADEGRMPRESNQITSLSAKRSPGMVNSQRGDFPLDEAGSFEKLGQLEGHEVVAVAAMRMEMRA